MNTNFVKFSALSDKQKSKLRDYWAPLWGSEVSKALTTDFMTSGSTKKVEASSKGVSKKKVK